MRDLPFPQHLRSFVRPIFSRSKKDHVFTGRLRCECSSMTFELKHAGATRVLPDKRRVPVVAKIGEAYFFRITARCVKCDAEHLVFDQDFHGWNGFVGHDRAQRARPRPPLVAWGCVKCKSRRHGAVVSVSSQGRRDFREEAPDLEPSLWTEAFESLGVQLTCRDCARFTQAWAACEAM